MDWSTFIPDYVRSFEAYTPSKPDDILMAEYGCSQLHRLNNNENPLGPPMLAAEIIRRFPPEKAALYPSGDSYSLRRTLSERFGLSPDGFLVGNGSCEVITAVIKAFCAAGDNIVTADRTFAVYEWVASFSGVEARLVPLVDFTFDDEGILSRIDGRTKILFLCNPNNPTGTWWGRERMHRFLERVDGRCIVVVDEAYREYVSDPDFPDGYELMRHFENVVVFRTFSKMYALAGLRIGYLAASETISQFIRKTVVAYSVNRPAQEAAQAALLDDGEHIEKTQALVAEGKALLKNLADELGFPCQAGEGNWVMMKTPVNDTLLYRKLMKQGFMIRTMTGFRFPGWIRITIREMEVMRAFGEAMRKIFAGEHENGKA
jgi:histidinol-phosphate aminotransferase